MLLPNSIRTSPALAFLIPPHSLPVSPPSRLTEGFSISSPLNLFYEDHFFKNLPLFLVIAALGAASGRFLLLLCSLFIFRVLLLLFALLTFHACT